MDKTSKSAAGFKAIGDPTRLRILEFLCQCSSDVSLDEQGQVRTVQGPTVGEVCCNVLNSSKITSSLSFHLKELKNAGLITMVRRGKNFVCCINREAVQDLGEHLISLSKPICCP